MNGAGPGGIQAAPLAPGTVADDAAPRPLPPSGPGKRIVVRPGQSVGYLAREYGVSERAIIDANNLTPPYKIEIGKELVIPGARQPPGPSASAGTGGRGGKAVAAARRSARPLCRPGRQGARKSSRSTSRRRKPPPRKSAEAPAIAFPPAAAPAPGKSNPGSRRAARRAATEPRGEGVAAGRAAGRKAAGICHGRCAAASWPATA